MSLHAQGGGSTPPPRILRSPGDLFREVRHETSENSASDAEAQVAPTGAGLEPALIFDGVRDECAGDQPSCDPNQGAVQQSLATAGLVLEMIRADSERCSTRIESRRVLQKPGRCHRALNPRCLGSDRGRAQEQQAQGPASPQRRVNGISPRIG